MGCRLGHTSELNCMFYIVMCLPQFLDDSDAASALLSHAAIDYDTVFHLKGLVFRSDSGNLDFRVPFLIHFLYVVYPSYSCLFICFAVNYHQILRLGNSRSVLWR